MRFCDCSQNIARLCVIVSLTTCSETVRTARAHSERLDPAFLEGRPATMPAFVNYTPKPAIASSVTSRSRREQRHAAARLLEDDPPVPVRTTADSSAMRLATHAMVKQDDARRFDKISRTEKSGKTGRPISVVELFPDGTLLLRTVSDGRQTRGRIAQRDLEEIASLLGQGLINETVSDCDAIRSTDAASYEIAIDTPYKTTIFRVFAYCRPSGLLKLLDDILSRASANH